MRLRTLAVMAMMVSVLLLLLVLLPCFRVRLSAIRRATVDVAHPPPPF